MRFLSLLIGLALTFGVALPKEAQAVTKWKLHVIDCTGSMNTPYNQPDNRFDRAVKKAIEEMSPRSNTQQALWKIDGQLVWDEELRRTVDPGKGEKEYFEVEGWTIDGSFLSEKAKTLQPTGAHTPLADVICLALKELESVGKPDDFKYLYVTTDGNEWSSGRYWDPTMCSEGNIASHRNNYLFRTDARKAYASYFGLDPDAKETDLLKVITSVPDNLEEKDQRRWEIHPVVSGAPFFMQPHGDEQIARAYQEPGTYLYYDWAAGVQPGSWEWRMYYRMAYGIEGDKHFIPSEPVNREWQQGAINPNPVIVSFVNFYDCEDCVNYYSANISQPPSGASMTMVSPMMKVAPMSLGEPLDQPMGSPEYAASRALAGKITARSSVYAPGPAVTNPTPTQTAYAYHQYEIDNATFSGLAQLTGGKFEAAPDQLPVPKTGDVDKDGDVDQDDADIVISWLGYKVVSDDHQTADADIDPNGVIDNDDLALLGFNWTAADEAPPPNESDVNRDGCVNNQDLEIIQRWYGHSVQPGATESYQADLNADGEIDDADIDLLFKDTTNVLFVESGYYYKAEKEAIAEHLAGNCDMIVDTIAEDEISEATDLTGYDLLVATSFSGKISYEVVDHIVATNQPALIFEYFDFDYSKALGLVKYRWCGGQYKTGVDLTGEDHEVLDGIDPYVTIYEKNSTMIGVPTASLEEGVTPLVYSRISSYQSSYNQTALLVDDERKIVVSGLYHASRYTDDGWLLFDNIVRFLTN